MKRKCDVCSDTGWHVMQDNDGVLQTFLCACSRFGPDELDDDEDLPHFGGINGFGGFGILVRK